MYEFSLATRIVFGINVSDRIADEISKIRERFPSNALIISTDDRWCEGYLGALRDQLLSSGSRRVDFFKKVVPNPDKSCAQLCIEACYSCHYNAIIAFGGGSSMDVAKLVAEESGVDLLVNIPTTAGTGSEISPWAVITNNRTREKESLVEKTPDLAILDPVLTVSMPPSLTLFSGLDAFAHGLEAYVSKAANTITDTLSLQAVKLIGKNLENAVEHGRDMAARSRMLEGSLLAGIAMLHAGLGLIHAIANTLGGIYHEFPHGLIIAHLIEYIMNYNRVAMPEDKYDKVESQVTKIIKVVNEKRIKKHIQADVEVHEEDIKIIVERSTKNINASTNPKDFLPADIENIIRQSFKIRR